MAISGGKPTSQLKLELSYIFAFSFIWKSISHSYLTVEYSKDRKPHIALPFDTAVALGRWSFSTKICAEIARLIWGGRVSMCVCVVPSVLSFFPAFSIFIWGASVSERQGEWVSVCVCIRERETKCVCVCVCVWSPLCSLSLPPAFSTFTPSAPKNPVLRAVKQPLQSCLFSPSHRRLAPGEESSFRDLRWKP